MAMIPPRAHLHGELLRAAMRTTNLLAPLICRLRAGFREIFDREWLGEGKPVMFEGIGFVAPARLKPCSRPFTAPIT